jgi:ketosteroid isomerase-like protein
MANANEQLVNQFYQAFQKRDGDAMAACYHPDAAFEDEVFCLQGEDVGLMWKMLCTQAKEFRLEFSEVHCDELKGSAHWEPRYRFSMTNRDVHNIVDATFEFKDGLIYRHRDRFDFWRWSKQALGVPGQLMGWSSLLRNKVRKTASRNLQRYKRSL